jgi:hypothetical protein
MNKFVKEAQQLHLLSDQQGIINRFAREFEYWQSHLDNCKKHIIDASKLSKNKAVGVIGSGWLLDIPIEFLCDYFEKVYLIDICHPPQIIKKLAHKKNVFFVTQDVTAGAVSLAAKAINTHCDSADFMMQLSGLKPHFDNDFSCLISLNILTQIGGLLTEALSNKLNYSTEECIRIEKFLQQAHLNLLNAPVNLLISEYKQIEEKNAVLTEKDLLFGDSNDNKIIDKWDWMFDMSGNYIDETKVWFKIMTIVL